MSGRTRQELIAEDVRDLARLGYAQQLFREMGGFSNFAISFSIISVLTGAVLLFGYGPFVRLVFEAPERNVGIGKSGRVRRGVAGPGSDSLGCVNFGAE